MSEKIQREIVLSPLTSLNLDTQFKIREIRNEEGIRKWMYTDHIIGIDEHTAWIDRLKDDNRQIVFAILDENKSPLGIVSVNSIDRLHERADWAYYLTEKARGGLGSALEYFFLNFIFESLNIKKLNCEVISGNDAVIKLHGRFLFKEEGFKKSNIVKNGSRIGVHLLGLTKEEWCIGKSDVYLKYGGALDRFKFSFSPEWTCEN